MTVVTNERLRQLIQSSLDARGWKLPDLQRATKRIDPDGRGVAYSSLAAWMNPHAGQGLPKMRNLDLVARALGLNMAVVREAAGYRVEEPAVDDPDLQVFIADAQRMSPEARARLMRIVRGIMSDEDLFPKRRNGNG